jgi:eukaryotic-like serine/threonine-protein kinase
VNLSLAGCDIRGELYRDNTGIVYKAWDTRFNRLVAVKVLKEEAVADLGARERFLREARAMAALAHPHVPRALTVGCDAGTPFLVMQLVEGGTLAGRLAAGRIVPRTAARLLAAVAGAVQCVHERGLLHRDLKPAHILLDGQPDTPLEQCQPYLAGFGFVRGLGGNVLGAGGTIIGTPAYLSPEQARGDALTGASDVWSLGVTLYECLTGRLPFPGPKVSDALRQIEKDEPVPPRSLVPGLDGALETVCLKCLKKDPARRYTGAAALAGDLERWHSEPAPAPGFLGRLSRRFRGE